MGIPPVFSGISSYASDLQQVINRTVAIASMPLTQLSNQQQDMNAQASALAGLDSKFSALQDAIGAIEAALGPSSYSATSSDPASVSSSVSAGALEGSYTISVNDAGASETAISSASLPAVSDPYSSSFSSSNVFTLTVGGQTFQISPTDQSLMGLATAINDVSAGVQASLVNVGDSTSPQYRLVVRANGLGPTAIQLSEGAPGQSPPGADLLDQLNPGVMASYTISGVSQPIQSASRTVTLAPGVTIDLLRQTSAPVTVTVARGADSIASAVSAFVDAYNAAVDELDGQVGKDAGALSGQMIVRSLFSSLRQINQYSAASGSIGSLAAMGVQLDSHGKLSFDASQFDAQSVQAIQSFLGSASGGGFLMAASDAMKSVEDATTGSLKSAITLNSQELTRQNDLITQTEDRINELQDNLQQQMAAADALLASLESQRDYMTNLFTAMMNANNAGVKSN